MQVQYVSDLHLEHRGGRVPVDKIAVAAPTLVLAGDIGCVQSRAYRELLAWCDQNFQHTLLLLGNHEHYSNTITQTYQDIEEVLQPYPSVHWLHRKTWDHPSGVRFAGATLWSEVTSEAFSRIMDGKAIRWDAETPFTREHYLDLHRQDVAFFEQAITDAEKDGVPLVCLSHHAPLLEMNGTFEDSPIRSAFCTDLSHLFRAPVCGWICGHTHQSLRVDPKGIPCVSNCLGYPYELGMYPGYQSGAVLEIPN